MVDYLPFVILLWGLYTTAGGILIKGNLPGTPLVNTLILLAGTIIASWIGTTGAAMLLIRPLLRLGSLAILSLAILLSFSRAAWGLAAFSGLGVYLLVFIGTRDAHARARLLGFALAAILTIIPFYLVMAEVDMARSTLVGIIMGLGAVQIVVHLVYFLHLKRSSEEGWNFFATIFAVIILVIVLAGSLWVMHNMNENMMPMHDMEQQLEQMRSLQSQQG